MHIIIPARYDSTRLPGKPLQDVCGKPLIQRVYECARQSDAQGIIIATDDERVRDAVMAFGAQVCMTSREHRSGTERIAEAIQKLALSSHEIVVNLQGDEPLMPPSLIRLVADTLAAEDNAVVATAMHGITDHATLHDPNVVKVVCDHGGFALYFSRTPIPWSVETTKSLDQNVNLPRGTFRHIGLYAYRAGFVARYASWPACPLEEAESLEQLRVLWYGGRIVVCETSQAPGPGVDTPEDLERVRKIFQEISSK